MFFFAVNKAALLISSQNICTRKIMLKHIDVIRKYSHNFSSRNMASYLRKTFYNT